MLFALARQTARKSRKYHYFTLRGISKPPKPLPIRHIHADALEHVARRHHSGMVDLIEDGVVRSDMPVVIVVNRAVGLVRREHRERRRRGVGRQPTQLQHSATLRLPENESSASAQVERASMSHPDVLQAVVTEVDLIRLLRLARPEDEHVGLIVCDRPDCPAAASGFETRCEGSGCTYIGS